MIVLRRPPVYRPRWEPVGQVPTAFERAGGLLAPGETARWNSAPVDQAGREHRFRLWQGTPPAPIGSAPAPISCNLGKGVHPTYTRFEMRHGPQPRDAAAYDPLFDEREHDFDQYTRDAAGEDIRCRSERSLRDSRSDVTSEGAATHVYEIQFFLPTTWAGAHISAVAPRGKIAIAQLPVVIETDPAAVRPASLYATRGDGSSDFFVQIDWIGSLSNYDNAANHYSTSLANILGRWVKIRIETQWKTTAAASGRLLIDDVEERTWTNIATLNVPTFRAYPKYGIYMTGVGGLAPKDFYDPGAGRETVVWYTGVQHDSEIGRCATGEVAGGV